MSGLLQTIAAAPSRTPLFADGERAITIGQIRKTASAIAPVLSGESVYLHTQSAALFAAGLLAASRKRITVCLPAHVQPAYLREIGAGLVLTDRNMDGAICIALAEGEEEATNGASLDAGLVFYTSGVTGAPKEVHKNIAQIDSEARVLDSLWGASAGHVVATVSHQHIYGMLFRVFWPALSGRVSADRAAEYWESLAGNLAGATLVSSPAHLSRLPPPEIFEGEKPGLIFSSGAPLPNAAAKAASDVFGILPIEVLGSTETGGVAWRQQDSADALWTPLPEVEIGIGDDGALSVTSPFADGTVATGDVAERAGGKIRLKGRINRIAKIDGKRVSLARVEEMLAALPMVKAARATDLPNRKGALGAIVELNDEGLSELRALGAFRFSRQLRAALAETLEPSERPKYWRFGAIPLNSQGKSVQAMLRAEFDKQEASEPGTVIALEPATAEVEIALHPDMIWFQGHFPGQAVMPGIAQVHLAAQWAERLWQWRPEGAHLFQLKFRRILRPNDVVRLSLERQLEKRRLKFAFRLGDILASDGMIGGAA